MYALYNKQFVVVAPAVLLMVAYTGTMMRTTILIHTPNNALFFVAVACIVLCIVLGLMPNLPAGDDVFKVLEAWISAFFLLTMVTNVLCSGKFTNYILVKSKDTPSTYTRTQGRLP